MHLSLLLPPPPPPTGQDRIRIHINEYHSMERLTLFSFLFISIHLVFTFRISLLSLKIDTQSNHSSSILTIISTIHLSIALFRLTCTLFQLN